MPVYWWRGEFATWSAVLAKGRRKGFKEMELHPRNGKSRGKRGICKPTAESRYFSWQGDKDSRFNYFYRFSDFSNSLFQSVIPRCARRQIKHVLEYPHFPSRSPLHSISESETIDHLWNGEESIGNRIIDAALAEMSPPSPRKKRLKLELICDDATRSVSCFRTNWVLWVGTRHPVVVFFLCCCIR